MRQLKNYLKFLTLGLLCVLTACSGTGASQSAPVKETLAEVKPEAPPVDQSQPHAESEAAVESAQGSDNTPAMAENSVVAKEEKEAGEEAIAASTEKTVVPTTEPAAMSEAMPEKTEMAPEAALPEEKAMPGPTNTSPAGPTETQLKLLDGLENRGAPPELFNQVWLNSEPLKLADLRGKVVIVEFWTFG